MQWTCTYYPTFVHNILVLEHGILSLSEVIISCYWSSIFINEFHLLNHIQFIGVPNRKFLSMIQDGCLSI